MFSSLYSGTVCRLEGVAIPMNVPITTIDIYVVHDMLFYKWCGCGEAGSACTLHVPHIVCRPKNTLLIVHMATVKDETNQERDKRS